MTRRSTGLLVPLLALVALLVSGGWLVSRDGDPRWRPAGFRDGDGWGSGAAMMSGAGMMGGAGMLGGYGWPGSDGRPVRDLAQARDRAALFARALDSGLRVGEVMRFTNHYYAELEKPDGTRATEVLVVPRTGAVSIEPGPAMMWNTRYGMMRPQPDDTAAAEVDAARAREIADRWLQDRGGLRAGVAEAFPGYYTLHALRDGRIEGMLSVHGRTGVVWYHSWHGRFVSAAEPPEPR